MHSILIGKVMHEYVLGASKLIPAAQTPRISALLADKLTSSRDDAKCFGA